MGLINRAKQAPSGVRDVLNDGIQNGVTGAILNALTNFGQKNAAARQTIGEDVGRRL